MSVLSTEDKLSVTIDVEEEKIKLVRVATLSYGIIIIILMVIIVIIIIILMVIIVIIIIIIVIIVVVDEDYTQ